MPTTWTGLWSCAATGSGPGGEGAAADAGAGAMRIVGGRWAGRELVSPGGRVRPTAEELRDAWLESLEADIAGGKILDLFAGTGALGLEALSRGAASADFVENGAPALHALKANIAKLRAKSQTRLFKKDVFQFLENVANRDDASSGESAPPYAVALADPPYTSRAGERLVKLWLERPFSRILSVEHGRDVELPGRGKRRVFGDSAVTTYRLKPGRRLAASQPS